ncbi:MAG: hypothetical protein FJ290_32150 [Planctomycetes bacterium]|nr:hypothetical protein [Planctomycetota bacterium]
MPAPVPKKIVAQKALAEAILKTRCAADLDFLRDRYIIRTADHPWVEFTVRLSADMSPMPDPKWKVRAMAQGQIEQQEIGGAHYLLFAKYWFLLKDAVIIILQLDEVSTKTIQKVTTLSGNCRSDLDIFVHTTGAVHNLNVQFGWPLPA